MIINELCTVDHFEYRGKKQFGEGHCPLGVHLRQASTNAIVAGGAMAGSGVKQEKGKNAHSHMSSYESYVCSRMFKNGGSAKWRQTRWFVETKNVWNLSSTDRFFGIFRHTMDASTAADGQGWKSFSFSMCPVLTFDASPDMKMDETQDQASKLAQRSKYVPVTWENALAGACTGHLLSHSWTPAPQFLRLPSRAQWLHRGSKVWAKTWRTAKCETSMLLQLQLVSCEGACSCKWFPSTKLGMSQNLFKSMASKIQHVI